MLSKGSIFCFVVTLVLAIGIFCGTSVASTNQPSSNMGVDMALETLYFTGDTTYHISFDNPWTSGGHGESELEFPLSNLYVGAHFTIYNTLHRREGYFFTVRYLVSAGGDAGTMKDSDWIENDLALCGTKCTTNTPGRDLYTESDDELSSSYLMEFQFINNFFSSDSFVLGLAAGYLYYEVNHDVTGCSGTYWGVPVSCVNAKVIEYRAEHSIPYIGVNMEFFADNGIMARLMLLYSGWVTLKDRDIHLYPDSDTPLYNIDRISSCDCTGSASIANMDVKVPFSEGSGFFVRGSYMDIEADGYQTQLTYINGVLVGINGIPINDTISTTLWSVGGGVYMSWP